LDAARDRVINAGGTIAKEIVSFLKAAAGLSMLTLRGTGWECGRIGGKETEARKESRFYAKRESPESFSLGTAPRARVLGRSLPGQECSALD